MKLLLNDKRVSIRKEAIEGKTAIDIAKEDNHSNIVELIQESDTGTLITKWNLSSFNFHKKKKKNRTKISRIFRNISKYALLSY